MKLFCFMVLLMFKAIPDDNQQTSSQQEGGKELVCNVTTCEWDEIFALIFKSNYNDLEIKHIYPESFASNNTAKVIYKRAENIYMDSICSGSETSTSASVLGDFNLTLLKLDTTDLSFHQISAEGNHTMSCEFNDETANITENYLFYNSTELEFTESINTSLCNWEKSRCYVECTSVNLTTNISGVNSVMELRRSGTITGKNNTKLVFIGSEIITACNVTKCESDEMDALIPNMDIIRLEKAQKMCNKTYASDIYFRAEKMYIDQQINLTFDGPNITYKQEKFIMTVFNIDRMNTMNDQHVKISAPKLSDNDPPIDVFFPIESFSKEEHKVGLVTYYSDQQFFNNLSTVLMSKVIRVETVGDGRKNLTTLLSINFTVNSSGDYEPSCRFYNEKEHRWDDMGSFTDLENFNIINIVNCSYDHMTPFAVLGWPKTPSCSGYTANITENLYFYNSTDLEFTESINEARCNWGKSECYVECTSVNLTTNISAENNITVVQSASITDQSQMLVFSIKEQNITCNITKCVEEEISTLIRNSSSSTDLKDLRRPTNIKSMCTTLFASNNIKNVYISAENKYIHYLISSPFNGQSKTYDLEEFSLIVVNMTEVPNATDQGHVHISTPKLSDDPPIDVFFPNVSVKLVGVVMYYSAQQFINDQSTKLKSKVIRVETVGYDDKSLTKPLLINFTVNSSEMILGKHTLSCQFYNEIVYRWDDSGSFTNLDNINSSNTVTCSYDHMTPFAVLLVDVSQIDPQQWIILSYISYIGCGLSVVFSVVTIFLYSFMKSSKRDSSIHIHVSLSVALFLLNTSFLLIEWGATWSQESVCVLIAVIIQYSLLSCFSWTAIEAIHLYLLLVKVFNTYIKHYMLKLSLFGWGVPAVLVGGSLCVYGSMPLYGTIPKILTNTNETRKFCWIKNQYFLYGMNISYFSLTFLFNTCVLVAVTHQIFKLRRFNIRGSKLPSCKDLCTVLGLTFLLEMTWGLAFFTSGYINYPILYLFCIFNTLHGLFHFLWFNVTMRKSRHLMEQTSSLHESTSTSVRSQNKSSLSH